MEHVTAGAADQSSRMGITLQGYDQVIALSQANINETLSRHFTSLHLNDDLGRFQYGTGDDEDSIDVDSVDAAVLPPKIELIDKDGADGALYVIHLGEGTYYTVIKTGKKLHTVEIPTNGWKLALQVDFAFKPVKEIPVHIARQVPLPGDYSVHQLMINFGDATRVLQLHRERCETPLAEDIPSLPKEARGKIDASFLLKRLEIFMKSYFEKLIQDQNRNVLGFAVKADQAPGNIKPTFVPAMSKVQIVGYRADGRAESFRSDHPYNAFCFTEMTWGRAKPGTQKSEWLMSGTEIKYSGNWFYGKIGGTLDMARSNFWEGFMVEKFKNAHIKATEQSVDILDRIASDKFSPKVWSVDSSKPARESMCGSYSGAERWGSLAYATSYKDSDLTHWNKDASIVANFWSKPRSTVHTLAKPTPRKGEIVIQQDIEISWEEGAELSNWAYINLFTAVAKHSVNAYIKGSVKLTLVTTISLTSALSTGDLQINSETKVTRSQYKDLEINLGGLVGDKVPGQVRKLINEWAEKIDSNYKEEKEKLRERAKSFETLFRNVAAELKDDLNNQNKFVFPGNGTFDMKDPIFSDNGDLMVGLTYH